MDSKPFITVTSLDEVLAELKHHGNNLNQLTKVIHEGQGVNPKEVTITLHEQVKIYRNLKD